MRDDVAVDERGRRVGQNEALFRNVNEEVRDVGEAFAITGSLRMVCECGEQTCIEQIEVSGEEYEAIRADPTHFAIKPGHDVPDVETVVARHPGYWVVRKDPGEPERIARETDPRS
jgi:hypothetical protein